MGLTRGKAISTGSKRVSVITIGPVQVKDRTIDVQFDTTQHVFFATVGKTTVKARSHADLVELAAKHIRAAGITLNVRVAQPDAGKVRFGTFKRKHATRGTYLIQWDDGEKEESGAYTYDDFYAATPELVNNAQQVNDLWAKAADLEREAREVRTSAIRLMGQKLNLNRIWRNAEEAASAPVAPKQEATS
jgi:hypothetical protein